MQIWLVVYICVVLFILYFFDFNKVILFIALGALVSTCRQKYRNRSRQASTTWGLSQYFCKCCSISIIFDLIVYSSISREENCFHIWINFIWLFYHSIFGLIVYFSISREEIALHIWINFVFQRFLESIFATFVFLRLFEAIFSTALLVLRFLL